MQWLMVALLVSVVALLLAAAGMVRHIRVQRARLRALEPAAPIVKKPNVESRVKVNQ